MTGARPPKTTNSILVALWAIFCLLGQNEILAIDFTVLEPTRSGLENVLVMTDVFTKYTWAVPTRDQRAETVAQVLVVEWFYRFGVPSRVHSDQGRILSPPLYSSFVHCMGWKSLALPLITRRGMDSASALIGPCTIFYRALPVSRKADWALCLPQVLFCYNTTPHQTTGESPYFLMFGQETKAPGGLPLGQSPGGWGW